MLDPVLNGPGFRRWQFNLHVKVREASRHDSTTIMKWIQEVENKQLKRVISRSRTSIGMIWVSSSQRLYSRWLVRRCRGASSYTRKMQLKRAKSYEEGSFFRTSIANMT